MEGHAVLQELPANIGAALALVPALEWAKRNGSPILSWVNIHTAPFISFLAAAAVAIGIHWSFDAHAGTLTITGLTSAALAQGMLEFSRQWLAQHWSHKLYQAFDTFKAVSVAVNKLLDVPTPSVAAAAASVIGKDHE